MPAAVTHSTRRVRVAVEQDIPTLVELFERVFPDHGWRSRSACAAYFQEILFRNPWRDPEIASLVAEIDGDIVGFYGIVPRPMLYRGRPIRAAIGCNFMVDPDRGDGLVALELLKAHLAGQQDLTLADGASAEAQGLWTHLGGRVPLVYNLHWLRPLRPARYLAAVLEQRRLAPRVLTQVVRPAAAAVDALVRRLRPNRFLTGAGEGRDEPVDAETMAAEFSQVACDKALAPGYDADSLAWLLEHAARKPSGTLRARRVLDASGHSAGWFAYYLRPGGAASEVVQVAARPGCYGTVLERLLADAFRHGATAVRGRLDADGAQALSQRHCWLRWEGPATLVHSRHAEIAAAIESGDAFLSRLDGEWWMRFMSG